MNEQFQARRTDNVQPGQAHPVFSRRSFLIGATAAGASGALAGCTVQEQAALQQVPPHPIIPAGTPSPAATPVAGGLNLEAFLALSSVLTGFDDLNPDLGRIYLQSLQTRPNPQVTLSELYQRAGFGTSSPPQSIDALTATGIFDDDATRSLVDTIITYWYTGIHDVGQQQVVATYVDALVWQAVDYLKPRTICGPSTGFWRQRPPAAP